MTEPNEAGGCGCHGDTERAEHDPAYRRALWIVVVLNLGFGVLEAVGGFVASSQALKADALDFLGDGSITLVGLLALAWSAVEDARSLARGASIQARCLECGAALPPRRPDRSLARWLIDALLR